MANPVLPGSIVDRLRDTARQTVDVTPEEFDAVEVGASAERRGRTFVVVQTKQNLGRTRSVYQLIVESLPPLE